MYYILFNPFNLVAPSCDNVGIIRDLVCYAALYFDPTSWAMVVGLMLCSRNFKMIPIQMLVALGTMLILMVITGAHIDEQLRNMLNILTLQDHHDTIGVFFYINIEIFKKHVGFFKSAYLIFTMFVLL